LRERLEEKRILLAPGVYDAFTALIAEQAGFEALYLTGAGIAYTRLGRPDIGLVTQSEVEDTLANICERVRAPVIVDADTGFGNAQNVQRTVRGLAAAGAACLMLEDQETPKRDFGAPCAVVSRGDAVRRVKAAVRAREAGTDMLIIGRTDARNAAGQAHGLDEALWRAAAFADLGADLVFVTGPHDGTELARIRGAAPVPQLVQVDEPGRPPLAPAQVHELGFEMALYGITLVLAAAAAFRDALAAMAAGRPRPGDRAVTAAEIGEIVGVADYLAVDRDLDA
jgi:2-methylisocitrate lyase-like PEP mutase family enzyme